MATKATDQAEESEGKFKTCIAEKENLLQKFADEKQELLGTIHILRKQKLAIFLTIFYPTSSISTYLELDYHTIKSLSGTSIHNVMYKKEA